MTGRSFSSVASAVCNCALAACWVACRSRQALGVLAGLVFQPAQSGGGFHLLFGEHGGLRRIGPQAQAGGGLGLAVRRQILLRRAFGVRLRGRPAAKPGASVRALRCLT